MMLKIILLMAILVNTQVDPTGKTYSAKVNETCKTMSDGGCMIYTYRVLNFKKDSVIVSYRVIAECSTKSLEKGYENMHNNLTKTYKWTLKNETINIEGFDEYGTLSIANSKLIGKDNIEFIEEIKKNKQ